MVKDTRNTKVVVWLVVSMTAGAALLLWLEPPKQNWASGALLMAEREGPLKSVRIEYLPAGQAIDAAKYDCLIFADGRCKWQPQSADIRLALLGSKASQLEEAQARTLLEVLGGLNQFRRLDLRNVRLDPASDARLNPKLPVQAEDLRNLLAKKGLIR